MQFRSLRYDVGGQTATITRDQPERLNAAERPDAPYSQEMPWDPWGTSK
ncbi:MAG TPA: hypothetical protein VMS74_03595 [Acidimicrobiia bacterium]|nr:hypothetical protein [Acidimicrobiia bacterium]